MTLQADEFRGKRILVTGSSRGIGAALAAAQDEVLGRLERANVQGECGPKLNKRESAEFWHAKVEKDGTLAPQRKLADEKPRGETVDYDQLIKSWPATPPKR